MACVVNFNFFRKQSPSLFPFHLLFWLFKYLHRFQTYMSRLDFTLNSCIYPIEKEKRKITHTSQNKGNEESHLKLFLLLLSYYLLVFILSFFLYTSVIRIHMVVGHMRQEKGKWGSCNLNLDVRWENSLIFLLC